MIDYITLFKIKYYADKAREADFFQDSKSSFHYWDLVQKYKQRLVNSLETSYND